MNQAASPRGALGPQARIESITSRPYRLPLRRPWRSARGVFAERRGWLVSVRSEGLRGYGDCAPLPGTGTEGPDQSALALRAWGARLTGLEIDAALTLLPGWGCATPAAVAALECALLDLQSRQAGVSLRQWMRGPSGAPAADWVAVNAALGEVRTLGPGDIARACSGGFRVIKLKVGLGDPDLELSRLAELARSLPDGVLLRLDANGAWDQETAARMIAALNGIPVESLEEPLATPDPGGLGRLQSIAGFPLALDESLVTLLRVLGPGRLPVRRAVLKPPVIGGLGATLGLARRLQSGGIEVALTGLVESAAGLWPTAQLAAVIGGALPHGLDTARWLAADLGPAPVAHAGRIRLPEGPGSGFDPHNPG